MIAPNAEVGKSVATSFAQLLSSRTHSVACAALTYRDGADGDWTAWSRYPKSLKL
jgi:predicted HD phosphohydrolase